MRGVYLWWKRIFLTNKQLSGKGWVQNSVYKILFVTILGCNQLFVNAAITSTAAGGNWNSSSSWMGGVVPQTTDDVIISAGSVITVNVTDSIRNLTVDGTLNINANVTLSVYGNVVVNAGGKLQLPSGNGVATLLVYGNYTNYGYTDFWKSTVIIAGNFSSPSGSAVQNGGIIVIGGNAEGTIDVSGNGSNQVFPINPGATINLPGITPNPTPPPSAGGLIDLVIYGSSSCGFTINGPANATGCIGSNVSFVIQSTTATSPSYQWEVNQGSGWSSLTDGGIYSGVTASSLLISGTSSGMNGYTYRCKVTDNSSCSKYSYSATLKVNPVTISPSLTISETSGLLNNDGIICQGSSVTLTASGGTDYLWSTGETTASVVKNTAGTYSVTVSDNGCSSTLSRTITVNPQPVTGAFYRRPNN